MSPEVVHAQLFEARTREGVRIIASIEQGVNLTGGLRGRRKGALSTFALSAETAQCPVVAGQVLAAVLALGVQDAESTVRLSKSSPPKWVPPAVALTSKIPSSMVIGSS